ncbi:unnamed protein product [marine sediment metagenome]|uniref:Uncharacterized protein n=1 Tax=marine sediment metagenome TaxID=412755 RepID=X1B893_9ZZZZ
MQKKSWVGNRRGRMGIGGIPCTRKPFAAHYGEHIVRFCEDKQEARWAIDAAREEERKAKANHG